MVVEDKYATIGGYRTRYWMLGDGPPVVLIHGLGACVEWWQHNIEALAKDFRVLAMDLPGFGLSDKNVESLSLAAARQFLSDFLDHFGLEKASFVGNSMGGLVALDFALRHPGNVSALVLAGSAGLGRELSPALRALSVPLLGELLTLPSRFASRLMLRGVFHDKRHATPDFVDLHHRMRKPWEARRSVLAATRAGVCLRGLRDEALRVDDLCKLDVPVLVVWGSQDRITPVSHAFAAHAAIPGSSLYVFDKCGHCVQIERAEEFNQLARRFLLNKLPGGLLSPSKPAKSTAPEGFT